MVSYQQNSKVRLLIVDDHELTRLSLKLLFSKQENIELVGLATNGQEAIDLVQQHQPDVIILDLQMPVMNGLTAASKIKYLSPKTRIIVYTSFDDPQTEVISQSAPIDVFCYKEASSDDLIELVAQLGQKSVETVENS